MKFTISARNVELPPEIKQYLERKLGRFNRQREGIIETRVEVIEENTRSSQDRFTVRVAVTGTGLNMFGQERAETIKSAADKVAEALKHQFVHQKGKLQQKGIETIRTATPESSPGEALPGRITSVKQMEVKPMSLEEAREQIGLLKYDYLLFYNTDSKSVNLLRRMDDGNYELIQSSPN